MHDFFFPLLVSLRFLFTDYNRLSSVGGETSMAEMIATLSDACEREFGFLAARLFRVFKNDEVQGTIADFGFRRQSSNEFSTCTGRHQTCY